MSAAVVGQQSRVLPAARAQPSTEREREENYETNLRVSVNSAELYIKWMSALRGGRMNQTETIMVLRELRNRILGHEALKRYLVEKMGLVECLVPFIEGIGVATVQQEAVVILGSLAYGGPTEVAVLVQHQVPERLLATLDSGDSRLLESAIRALRTIYRHGKTPRDLPFMEKYLVRLTLLLTSGEGRVAEYCAVLLANCCDELKKQEELCARGVVQVAINMALANRNASFSRLEAALDLLAAITRDNLNSTRIVSEDAGLVALLFDLLRRRGTVEIRIFAALCLTNLFRGGYLGGSSVTTRIPAMRNGNGGPQQNGPVNYASKPPNTDVDPRVKTFLIQGLVQLMDTESSVRARAAQVLALLISDSEQLQMTACEANVISSLRSMLAAPVNERESEAALLALAALASFKEECRRTVIDAKILPLIVTAMESNDAAVRSAACQCTRSLSRSVKNLRTTLVDVGMVTPLLRLLSDPSLLVQKTACAALCNLVLDFSPMKETVVRERGVQRLVELIGSPDADLRFNALWALKNLLYLADTPIKTATMELVTYPRLEALAHDPSLLVQEQVLNLIRNLVCEKEQDIAEVLAHFNESRLVRLLESKLNSSHDDIVMHSCYIVANACTASAPAPKEAIMASDIILDKVNSLLSPGKSAPLQLAALWCIINLTWTDDTGSADRIAHLRRRGFEKQLQTLMRSLGNGGSSSGVDIRDRIQTALDNFTALDPPPRRR